MKNLKKQVNLSIYKYSDMLANVNIHIQPIDLKQ
jgi:hypothetical protein